MIQVGSLKKKDTKEIIFIINQICYICLWMIPSLVSSQIWKKKSVHIKQMFISLKTEIIPQITHMET
jgi:hypothetical protein